MRFSYPPNLTGINKRFRAGQAGMSLVGLLRPPHFVPETMKVDALLKDLQARKVHLAMVVDEYGGTAGLATIEDLLEEIVGDISDEHDDEVNEQIHEQPDGTWLLEGGLAVRDVNKRLGLNLPISEGYTTVGGFMMSEAGTLLNQGDTVKYNGHIFRVEKAAKRRILQVRLERLKVEPEPDEVPSTS